MSPQTVGATVTRIPASACGAYPAGPLGSQHHGGFDTLRELHRLEHHPPLHDGRLALSLPVDVQLHLPALLQVRGGQLDPDVEAVEQAAVRLVFLGEGHLVGLGEAGAVHGRQERDRRCRLALALRRPLTLALSLRRRRRRPLALTLALCRPSLGADTTLPATPVPVAAAPTQPVRLAAVARSGGPGHAAIRRGRGGRVVVRAGCWQQGSHGEEQGGR